MSLVPLPVPFLRDGWLLTAVMGSFLFGFCPTSYLPITPNSVRGSIPLWGIDYFKLVMFKKQKTEEKHLGFPLTA